MVTLSHDPPWAGSLKCPMLIAQTATHTIEITCATHKQVHHEVQGATHPIGGLNIQFNLLLILLKYDRSVLGFNFCLVFL